VRGSRLSRLVLPTTSVFAHPSVRSQTTLKCAPGNTLLRTDRAEARLFVFLFPAPNCCIELMGLSTSLTHPEKCAATKPLWNCRGVLTSVTRRTHAHSGLVSTT